MWGLQECIPRITCDCTVPCCRLHNTNLTTAVVRAHDNGPLVLITSSKHQPNLKQDGRWRHKHHRERNFKRMTNWTKGKQGQGKTAWLKSIFDDCFLVTVIIYIQPLSWFLMRRVRTWIIHNKGVLPLAPSPWGCHWQGHQKLSLLVLAWEPSHTLSLIWTSLASQS
jgi:hypothetical protein